MKDNTKYLYLFQEHRFERHGEQCLIMYGLSTRIKTQKSPQKENVRKKH